MNNPNPGNLIQLCAAWNSESNTATTAHISILRHTPSKHSTPDHPRTALFDHPNTREQLTRSPDSQTQPETQNINRSPYCAELNTPPHSINAQHPDHPRNTAYPSNNTKEVSQQGHLMRIHQKRGDKQIQVNRSMWLSSTCTHHVTRRWGTYIYQGPFALTPHLTLLCNLYPTPSCNPSKRSNPPYILPF